MLPVMKVEGPRGVSAPLNGRRASGAAAPGFAPALDAPQRAAPAVRVQAPAALDAILALQAEEQPAQRRARQVKRGGQVLDALQRLEQGLLLGHAPGGLKSELESLQRAAQLTGDAGLDDVMREIDTRLAVELAKLERVIGRA